jgi:hypothetical protein
MEASLTEFLTGLLEDPARLDAFHGDRAGTMAAAGVSSEDQDAVLSGDPDRIYDAVGPEFVEQHQDQMQHFM